MTNNGEETGSTAPGDDANQGGNLDPAAALTERIDGAIGALAALDAEQRASGTVRLIHGYAPMIPVDYYSREVIGAGLEPTPQGRESERDPIIAADGREVTWFTTSHSTFRSGDPFMQWHEDPEPGVAGSTPIIMSITIHPIKGFIFEVAVLGSGRKAERVYDDAVQQSMLVTASSILSAIETEAPAQP